MKRSQKVVIARLRPVPCANKHREEDSVDESMAGEIVQEGGLSFLKD